MACEAKPGQKSNLLSAGEIFNTCACFFGNIFIGIFYGKLWKVLALNPAGIRNFKRTVFGNPDKPPLRMYK
jgi:hypothetical protein